MTQKSIIVTIDEDALDAMDSIKASLERQHVVINDAMDYGLIMGTVDDAQLPAIMEISGVESVEEELQVQLPPDSQKFEE